jgi:hypothetical protein
MPRAVMDAPIVKHALWHRLGQGVQHAREKSRGRMADNTCQSWISLGSLISASMA